jgi:hypothetical protein
VPSWVNGRRDGCVPGPGRLNVLARRIAGADPRRSHKARLRLPAARATRLR